VSKLESLRHAVLPQGFRLAIPGWSNELVYLIKYSSLATFVTVSELFFVAEDIASVNFEYGRIFTLVALLYLGMVMTATRLTAAMERRVAVPGVGASSRR
jgi:polar amino acid transport system permease protein